MPKRKVTINGITYGSLVQASKELDVNYQKLQKLFLSGATEIEIDIDKLRYRYTAERPILYPEHLNNIDFTKEHTFEEISYHLYKLGLTDTQTTIPNISQMYNSALQKLLSSKIMKEIRDEL